MTDTYERGLNYVIVEKVSPLKAKDLVPTYDVEGNQTGTVRADVMLAELSQFSQMNFDSRNQKLIDVFYKYGLQYVFNREILMGDFAKKANWGIKNGKPIHLDGGTFVGFRLLTDYKGKKNMEDEDFREVYNRSKEFKKLIGDKDRNTMFSIETLNNDYIESELFKDISSIPFITKEQSLGVYKSIYTEGLDYWKDSDVKC